MQMPFILLGKCFKMHVPPKNSLGCNHCFPVSYSLKLYRLVIGAYSSTAACAAASLAIGTRNGEQLT